MYSVPHRGPGVRLGELSYFPGVRQRAVGGALGNHGLGARCSE